MPFKDSVYATMQQGKTAEANLEMNAKQNREDTEIDNAIPSTSSHSQEAKEEKDEKDNDLNKEEEEEKKENSEINEGSSTRSRKRMHKQRTCLLPQRDVYKSAQQLDFSYVLRRKNSEKNFCM